MKYATKHIILAALLALAVSCSKEPVAGEHGGGGSDGVRTISVSFGGATRTALGDKDSEGKIPANFTAGDVILVSNGKALEDCKVIIGDDGKASITTTLQGELDAVYPPEAAVYTGYDITGFKVSDSQSGRFEDAHVCTATIPEGTTNAQFSNKTAILKFYVDKSIGVTSIKVTSSGADIATGSKTITVTAPRGKTLADVTDDTKKRICYVAVLPGVNANKLTYETVTTTQSTLPRTPTDGVTLTASILYKAFIPYYITIGTQKWGYCNVGAFLPEEAGRYFMWGETVGQVPTGTTFTFPDTKYYSADNNSWDHTAGFGWANCPWTDGTYSDSDHKVFTKYTSNAYAKSGTADNKTVLEPADDAAFVNWGGPWRMPTGGTESTTDFTILANACTSAGYSSEGVSSQAITAEGVTVKGIYYCSNYSGTDGIKGLLFCDGTNRLFFPAAGHANGNALYNAGSSGYYWSTSLNTGFTINAGYMLFDSVNGYSQSQHYRCRGYSVRPVAD